MKCVIAAVGLFLFLNPSLGVEIVMKAESPIKMGVPARFFFASAAAPTAGRNNGEIPMLAGISARDKNAIAAIAHSGLNTQVQTARYDIFTYTIPAGFELTTQNNTVLVLEKKEGKHYCQLVLYAAKEAQTDAGKNFIQNWDFFARNPQQGIADPATSETGTFNNWQVRTGTAQGTFNRQPFSLTLRSFTKNSLNYFVGAVFTDARYVPAVQQFMDGVLADDTKNAVAKRPPDDRPMAQGSSSPLTQPVTSFNDGWTSTYVGPYVKVAKEGIEAWIFPANDSLDKAARQPDAVFEDKYWRYAVDRFFQTRHVAERPWQMSGPGNDKIFEAEVKNRQTGQENFVAMRVICSSGRCQSVLALAPTKQLLYSSVFANYNTFEQILPYNKFMPALPLLRGAWQGGEAGATGSYSIAGGFQGGNAKVAFKDEFVFKADNSYQSKHGLKQRNESKGEGYVQQYKGSYSLNGQTLQLTGWRPGDPGIFECWMEAAQGGLALILVNKKFTGQRYLLYRVP